MIQLPDTEFFENNYRPEEQKEILVVLMGMVPLMELLMTMMMEAMEEMRRQVRW